MHKSCKGRHIYHFGVKAALVSFGRLQLDGLLIAVNNGSNIVRVLTQDDNVACLEVCCPPVHRMRVDHVGQICSIVRIPTTLCAVRTNLHDQLLYWSTRIHYCCKGTAEGSTQLQGS